MCCDPDYISSGLTTSALCAQFLSHRPACTTELFEAMAISQLRGDPHITTLDDLTYTFNGHGEFIMIESNDASFMNFTLQVSDGQTHY